jgi:ATPase subunit of ABC transporter with duplicated ATPase domains
LARAATALGAERPLSTAVPALTGLEDGPARTALAAFGLEGDIAGRAASTLAPGERTRAELAVLAHRSCTALRLERAVRLATR